YVFIDEVQYADEGGKKLKYIYDTENVKLIISGSSSAEISIQSLKYLVGRIYVFNLLPFSFSEFLSARNEDLIKIYEKKRFGEEINKRLLKYVNEFLIFGGYPRVVLSEDEEEKRRTLQNIFNTLILREVRDLFGVASNDNFVKLLKVLAAQIGNIINYAELCAVTGIKLPELKRYFSILEELYILKRCYPFAKNKRTEIVKAPKIYFIDYGLRNVILDNFSAERPDKGALYENLIFAEYLKNEKELKYWRTKSGAEVDFIDDEIPIEIKTVPKTGKSLRSFITKYSPETAYIVSEREQESVNINGITVRFLPFSKFI
ncbi:MAG: ATP-binding protein, partial [Chlorobi bacterium]|nr:ATP-binding protein [Chlorobiota bacterium]